MTSIFPRQPWVLDVPVINLAFKRAKEEKTESSFSAMWQAILEEKFPHREGYLCESQKYFTATPEQQKPSSGRHKWFKIDHAIDKPNGALDRLITIGVVEIKKPYQSAEQDDEGEYNLTRVCEAAVHKDQTGFVWAIQCKGLVFTQKYFKTGKDKDLDPRPGSGERNLRFPEDWNLIESNLNKIKDHGLSPFPTQRHSTAPHEPRHGPLPVREGHETGKGTFNPKGKEEVKGERSANEGKDGWRVEYRGKTYFMADTTWTKHVARNGEIFESNKLPIYLVRRNIEDKTRPEQQSRHK